MSNLKILVPTAEIKKRTIAVASIPDLSGKVVCFASNDIWDCLVPIWKKFDEVLRAKYGVAEIFKAVISAARQTPAEFLDETASKSAAAIVGLGG